MQAKARKAAGSVLYRRTPHATIACGVCYLSAKHANNALRHHKGEVRAKKNHKKIKSFFTISLFQRLANLL